MDKSQNISVTPSSEKYFRFVSTFISPTTWNAIPKTVVPQIARQIGIDASIDLTNSEDVQSLCSEINFVVSESMTSIWDLTRLFNPSRLNLTKKSLSDLARLVNSNPTIKWKTQSLLIAVRHIAFVDFIAKNVIDRDILNANFGIAPKLTSIEMLNSLKLENSSTKLISDNVIITQYARNLLEEFSSRKTIIEDKTPQNPMAIDFGMLLTMCLIFNIPMNLNDSPEDLQHYLRCFLVKIFIPSKSISHSILQFHQFGRPLISNSCDACGGVDSDVRTMQISQSTTTAVTIASSMYNSTKQPNMIRNLSDPTFTNMLRIIHPDSPGNSIVLAAAMFKLDISLAECPISEYYKIVSDIYQYVTNRPNCEKFVSDIFCIWEPFATKDSKLYKCYVQCPYSLILGQSWLPQFRRFYSPIDTQILLEYEGFEKQVIGTIDTFITDESPESAAPAPPKFIRSDDVDLSAINVRRAFSSAESALDYAKMHGTVIVGLASDVENEFSPIYYNSLIDEVSEKGAESVICFRFVEHANLTRCIGITVEDFIEILNNFGAFVIPFSTHRDIAENFFLSRRIVKRLKYLCSYFTSSSNINSTTKLNWTYLDKSIKCVIKNNISKLMSLASGLTILNPREKEGVISSAFALRDVGMYMRGWKVSDATRQESDSLDLKNIWPLESCQTTYDPLLQSEVDLLVTNSLAQLNDQFLKPGGSIVASFPLLKKHIFQGALFYTPSLKRDQGYTIQDRINIIRFGDSEENPHSCIRMSSNFILATSYFILSAMNRDPGFSINQMSSIF